MPSEEGTAWQVFTTLSGSQSQNLALTVFYMPYSLDSGCSTPQIEQSRAGMNNGMSSWALYINDSQGHIHDSQGHVYGSSGQILNLTFGLKSFKI